MSKREWLLHRHRRDLHNWSLDLQDLRSKSSRLTTCHKLGWTAFSFHPSPQPRNVRCQPVMMIYHTNAQYFQH